MYQQNIVGVKQPMETAFDRKLDALIIEDNPLDARLLRSMLAKTPLGSFESQSANSLKHAFEQLQ